MNAARPTARGVLVLACAAVAYAAGWAFGTEELGALALVLLLAPILALALVALVARRAAPDLERTLSSRSVAGRPLRAEIAVGPPPPFVAADLVDAAPGLGDPRAALVRAGTRLTGAWEVAAPARGRYALAPVLLLEDPFGLARAALPLARGGLVRVEPRLVPLGAPAGTGLADAGGARRPLIASAGDELAGVRDHQAGEPLRRVHWGTTARRGRLSVRETEERPHGELAVLLDGSGAPGPAFERAVEAAGSLALHALRQGVAVELSATGAEPLRVAARSQAGAALLLDALCAVAPGGARPLARSLPASAGPPLCLVTTAPDPELVLRVAALRARRRTVAVVLVTDAGENARVAAALRRAGAEVAVLAPGADLAATLAPLAHAGVAGAA